ncbi:MAG: Asp-tRNA(Asn)/Glu-tRNA(Gln) amidotransferase subunit GatB [Betaproteobacteria bacterium]|nr:Asp-tRNA(Asn)/Glu-tRNA(Gln) amidotransferase subunit GatB [Betaproteobacteria bacterium]
MSWEVVIGLETHAQLSTASKMFSGSPTEFGAPPNAQANAVDIALPGVLPVANRGAVDRAIRFGLAVGATINMHSVFARKNYFYPDLPKGYQISQYELPIVQGGTIDIVTGNEQKTVRLTRAHLEEDAGKSLHEAHHDLTGIDLNRAGTPLLEIVTEPEMRSAAEAVAYARALHGLVRWIDICDGNMQEGSFRCDANVSVRRPGEPLGTRCEIKNLNSFRFLERAIEFETRRQIEILEDGGRIVQQTRLYDPERDETRSMRSKEEAHDYRYFPDPDLMPVVISQAWLERVRNMLPELPGAKRDRYVGEFGLSAYDAATLTQSRETATYFEDVLRGLGQDASADSQALAKLCANWVSVELAGVLNESGLPISESPVSSGALAGLLRRVSDGTLSGKMAREVFAELCDSKAGADDAADAIIASRGLKQISDTGELEGIVDAVLAANQAQVAQYRAGKEKAFNYLVGQAMKATKGKGNPAQLNEILRNKLTA